MFEESLERASQLDPDEICHIRSVTFKIYPLGSKEPATDEANRRLNRKKHVTVHR